jgi:hypothetical protein
MKLYTFGDSWTEGVGGDLAEENAVSSLEEKTKIRSKYSWPKQLAEKLKIDLQNYGVGGSDNRFIFNCVCKCIDTGRIKENDLVIIMWSSPLREELPFFPPDNEWHSWSKRHLDKKYIYDHILSSNGENKIYNKLKIDYKEWYTVNLYNENYYNIVNQGYLLYLQYMFKNLGIRYLFCDGFDMMLPKNIIGEIDKTDLIDTRHYWGFRKETFRDFLTSFDKKSIWENFKNPINLVGVHPNKLGYELISDEIYRFIGENKIISEKTKGKINILI